MLPSAPGHSCFTSRPRKQFKDWLAGNLQAAAVELAIGRFERWLAQLRVCTMRTMMPAIDATSRAPATRQATQRLQEKLNGLPGGALCSCVGIEVGKKLNQLSSCDETTADNWWKLKQPSSSDETNQAARLATGQQARVCLRKGQARVCGLWRSGKSRYFRFVSPNGARNAKPPGLPKEVQTVSERFLWESLS